MSSYIFDDVRNKSSEVNYTFGQALPPKHWYQKSVGWFGKSVLGLAVFGMGVYYIGVPAYHDRVNVNLSSKINKLSESPATVKPIEDKTPDNIVEIQSVLDNWQATHKGEKWAVVARSISGPSFDAQLNVDQQFNSASIYKLFLTLPLYEKLPADKQNTTNIFVDGKSESIAECVDVMLRLSNNECGEALGAYVGWDKISKSLKQNKFNNTSFGGSGIKTTVADTATFLERLSVSDLFDNKSRDFIMSSLSRQKWRDGIPSGCPGCNVANKTGQIEDVTHDAGIVRYQSGSYVLVIFSEKGSFKEISQLTGQIQQKILDTTSAK